jgi:hypothetical protein
VGAGRPGATARHALAVRLALLALACGGGGGSGGGGGGTWAPSSARPIALHWQLSGELDPARDLPLLVHRTVFDLDGELTPAATVAALHALGPDVKVACYLDAGAYESYRSDASLYLAHPEIIGSPDVGWEGGFWLDIRRLDLLLPILRHRMADWCLAKGFDAVEPDETEVHGNASGFPITQDDNDAFNHAVAALAHEVGLSVALKGNNGRAAFLAPDFDWALSEQCWQYEECDGLKAGFADQGKAVFTVDYDAAPDCATASAWHLNSMRRDLDLVGPRDPGYLYQPCLPDTATAW